MFVIKEENLPKMFEDVDVLLGNIEVKGDSVQHLFRARALLRGIFELIKEEPEEKEGG